MTENERYCPFMFNSPTWDTDYTCMEETCMAWMPAHVNITLSYEKHTIPGYCKLIERTHA